MKSKIIAVESQRDFENLPQIDIKQVHVMSSLELSVELSEEAKRPSNKMDYVTVVILFIINLLNYIDRYSVAGILDNIKEYYNMNDKQAGMLQTSFILTYMIMSPIFGYLGDRISRKKIILGGVTFWSIISLASSFVPSNMFALFVVLRSLVGVGEASYSIVAPTIIADLFTDDLRSKVIAFFFFAIPIGSGLGFIIGYAMLLAFKEWQYALRLSPFIGIFCVILLFFFVHEPKRGLAEGGTHFAPSPWVEDIRQLTKNSSFILISFGFTFVCFVIGSITWWYVIYLNYSVDALHKDENASKNYNISIIFGMITVFAGIIGVAIGAESGRRLRKIWPSADPIVCGIGLVAASPFIVLALAISKMHLYWALFVIFIVQILLALNLALVADMTMGVVIPTRRATATAYQMILSHAFGDAGSPYIIGAISDALYSKLEETLHNLDAVYYALQYALYINPIISVLGGVLFLWSSLYIVKDKKTVFLLNKESTYYYETVGSSYTPGVSQLDTFTLSLMAPVSKSGH